jgi:hypothetical protein
MSASIALIPGEGLSASLSVWKRPLTPTLSRMQGEGEEAPYQILALPTRRRESVERGYAAAIASPSSTTRTLRPSKSMRIATRSRSAMPS